MPRPIALAALIVLAAAPVGAADLERGEQVYESTCSACHARRMSPDEVRGATNLQAPPMNLMTTHMRMKLDNSKDRFVQHWVDFTLDPTREKALANPRALRRFGLMPSARMLDPSLTADDIRAVAEWAWQEYDYDHMKDVLKRHLRMEPH
jgi:hypothetical protein